MALTYFDIKHNQIYTDIPAIYKLGIHFVHNYPSNEMNVLVKIKINPSETLIYIKRLTSISRFNSILSLYFSTSKLKTYTHLGFLIDIKTCTKGNSYHTTILLPQAYLVTLFGFQIFWLR